LAKLIRINVKRNEENTKTLFTFPEEAVDISNTMIKTLEPLSTIMRNIKVINKNQTRATGTIKL